MAQHDYNIANQNGAAFRADLNSALAAIQSQNSGATEPAATVAYMPWADTNAGLWKVRNAADSAWVSVMSLTASRVDTATGTSYDNSSSGLAATNVKDAIDEIITTGAGVPSQDQSTWNTGSSTTESRISPLKLDTKIKTLTVGDGQSWAPQARSPGVVYTNTTGRTIAITTIGSVATQQTITLFVDGEAIGVNAQSALAEHSSLFGLVPNGSTYEYTGSGAITIKELS